MTLVRKTKMMQVRENVKSVFVLWIVVAKEDHCQTTPTQKMNLAKAFV